MAEDKAELREFDLRQFLPWTELFRGFQVALDPKKLLLAAAGILVMAFWWWLWSFIFYASREKPDWRAGKYSADKWSEFKEARQKWNVLHETAGNQPEYTDANDLANSPEEFDRIKDTIDEAIRTAAADGRARVDVTAANATYAVVRKPHGRLRDLPWSEDRGPNPYLLVTGQTGVPWEAGHFWEWFLIRQTPVLIEPLVKFFGPLVYLLRSDAGFWNRVYFLLVMLGTLATWALFGGAITRMAAVQVARNDKISMVEAVRFVIARYVSFFSAPLFPLLFIVFMVVLLILFGLIHMIPYLGEVWDGLLWPLVILAGVAMAVVLVGLVGWPMMYATISTEGSDSFDAISRSYSYVYQSPWQYIWYCLVALCYGAAVVFFIGFMGSLIVYLGKWGVSQTPFVGKGYADRDPEYLFVYAPTSFGWRPLLLQGAQVDGQNLVERGQINDALYNKYVMHDLTFFNKVGAVLVAAWLFLFFLMVLGFAYSYFWSASTIIYLLMRRRVDDTDLDEIYLEEDETEEPYGLSTPSPAASAPAAAGPSLTMVESPTLRTPAGAAAPSTAGADVAGAAVSRPPVSPAPPAGEGARPDKANGNPPDGGAS
jgi:hypothetical protein